MSTSRGGHRKLVPGSVEAHAKRSRGLSCAAPGTVISGSVAAGSQWSRRMCPRVGTEDVEPGPSPGRRLRSYGHARANAAPDSSRWKGPTHVSHTRARSIAQCRPTAHGRARRLDIVHYDRRRAGATSERGFCCSLLSLAAPAHPEHAALRARLLAHRLGEPQAPHVGNRFGLLSADTSAFAGWIGTRRRACRRC